MTALFLNKQIYINVQITMKLFNSFIIYFSLQIFLLIHYSIKENQLMIIK